MNEKDEAFLKKLLATFRVEAAEHIEKMASGLIDLEAASDAGQRSPIVETVFREVHSLKGAARAVNLEEIEALCQAVESVFAVLKRSEIEPSSTLFDILHRGADALAELLSTAGTAPTAPEKAMVARLIRDLGGIARQGPAVREPKPEAAGEEPPPLSAPPAPTPQTVRIEAAKLDAIMLQAEEILSTRLFLGERGSELKEIRRLLLAWKQGWTKVIPDVRKMQQSIESRSGKEGDLKKDSRYRKVVDFLEWNEGIMRSVTGKLAAVEKVTEHDRRSLGTLAENHLTDIKKALMLPFSSLLAIFPKLVRDLAHTQGKKADLVIKGEEIEIDRRILEEIKDPLIHLVRNCLDHGIEKPEERLRAGKTARGLLTIEVTQQKGGKVEISVGDDGRGIDCQGVRTAALKAGLIAPGTAGQMTADDSLKLAFASGVSTCPIITDLSGRGLGLAIVREKIEKLGGKISLETVAAKGSSFRAMLPVTLATFRGVVVRMGEAFFVLPTAGVERVLRLVREEIGTVENREAIEIAGRPVSLARLSDVLGMAARKQAAPGKKWPAVVLGAAQKRIAFVVDEVMGEQEVLMKDLGPQLKRVRNIVGATVLGNGRVAPVLNVADLLASATEAPTGIRAAPAEIEDVEPKRKTILVVEDSITARTLLRNILEGAGYDVRTAVDGIEAYGLLATEAFDLAVSDVDMPRMNGFELTAKIRTDKKLAELPVVLVTALDSREDRERGIDVGANAYIVKSSFDQSNLLEVVKRLI